MNILTNRTIICVAFSVAATVHILGIPAGLVVFMNELDTGLHMPEWYYFQVIKPVTFIVFGVAALGCFMKSVGQAKLLAWPCIAIALLFNPFFYPPFMTRELWVIANIIVALICIWAIRRNHSQK